MTPSWDLFLTVFFIVGIAYGMLMQREKSVVTLVSIYVAIVLTQLLKDPIAGFFAGERTISSFFVASHVSPFTIQAGVFVVTLILISTKSGLSGGRDGSGLLSPLEIFTYSFLSTALVVTTLISYMPDASRAAMIESSKMAGYLVNHHTWWLLLPIAAILVFGWNRNPLFDR
ncbi:hypothetical protein HY374_03760 [Candidatus Berkelbacteria bacterium]|nr:hypothetical protein [Candidatus Berkelbacteria bacterium]